MANESKAKNFDFPKLVADWSTYNSSRDKTNVDTKVAVRGSQNMYKKLSGTWADREGQKRQGVANTVLSDISSEFVWNTSWGAVYTLVISNSTLYVVIDEVWYALLTGLTATRYVFDNWWSATEAKDRVLFVHGTSDIQHWSGGFATLLSSTVNTLTKTGTDSWKAVGFSDTAGEKTVVINGTTYTYTGGETTTTLTGVTPDPSAEPTNSIVLQSVFTAANTPTSTFKNDFIKIINNQVYAGSYTGLQIFMSQNTDFKNYVVPTPQLDGSPGLFIMPDTAKGIGVRKGNAHIGAGTGNWVEISFTLVSNNNIITRQNKIDVKPVALGQAPYAHEFIDAVGDNIIYLAQDQQVRALGDFNNLFVSGYPSLSQEIATELSEENFIGGGLRCIGEFVYVTAPDSGKTYLRQERSTLDYDGNVVSEKLWHAPFIWNITRIDSIDGTIVGFSNANPQIYQLWDTNQWHDDSPSDEPLPYTCILALGYRNASRRQGLNSFDKMYSEGYLTAGTPLNLLVNYNYLGSKAQANAIVNSVDQPAYLQFPNPDSLGDSSLGENPLGDVIVASGDADAIPKFRCINSLPLTNSFEYQPVFWSDATDARWEILAVGDNADVATDEPTFIINKRRN